MCGAEFLLEHREIGHHLGLGPACSYPAIDDQVVSSSVMPPPSDASPALLNKQSKRPKRSTACAIMAATSCSMETSALMKVAAGPSLAASSSPLSRRRPAMTTLAPS